MKIEKQHQLLECAKFYESKLKNGNVIPFDTNDYLGLADNIYNDLNINNCGYSFYALNISKEIASKPIIATYDSPHTARVNPTDDSNDRAAIDSITPNYNPNYKSSDYSYDTAAVDPIITIDNATDTPTIDPICIYLFDIISNYINLFDII